MEHTVAHSNDHGGNKNEVRNVTIILSVLTIVELILGYIMYKWVQEDNFLRASIKGTIIILMLAKAFYIVAYFMHLGHELKNLIMTIVVPLLLFVWFIISFLYEGDSYKKYQQTYDRFKKERSETKVDKAGHSNKEGTHEAPKSNELK
ncbi:MAG TPA: cytochrome C oxidase subunit IV family protein [Segetibacter sp.]|jgi:cytochrome c oxidase subunit IV